MEQASILIVDDEEHVRFSLSKALASVVEIVEEAGSGEEALDRLSGTSFDIVLTDIRMGRVSGIDLLTQIRERWPDVVVILLTGYASVETAIQALRRGAYDYLIKPVSIHELRSAVQRGLAEQKTAREHQEVLATLQEGIQRLSAAAKPLVQPADRIEPQCQRLGDLVVDGEQHLVTVAGEAIELTPTEFRLLLWLVENRDRVLCYEELVSHVYGYDCPRVEAKKLVMPHISNLRSKLSADSWACSLIENVRGVGYIVHTPGE
jgi:DNA-binding response OmpR family regulator